MSKHAPTTLSSPYVSVILACYNEEEILADSFAQILRTLTQFGRPHEIIFVDDRSRDETRKIIESLVRGHPDLNLRVILHDVNRGRGATVTDGFRAARGEIAGYLDVDLEVHSRYIPSLVEAIEQGADVATVRRIYAFQVRSLDRYIQSRGYDEIEDPGWFWDTEFMARSLRRGLRIEEVPGAFIRRFDKRSSVQGWRDSFVYLRKLLSFRKLLRAERR